MGDCQKVVDILYSIIDNEATPEEVTFFKKHVNICAPCLENYEIDKAVRDFLKIALEKKCCSESLIKDIKLKIKNIPD